MANTGTISPEELAKKLAVSKKIMNKVDAGDYEKGNINENVLSKSPEELAGVLTETPQQPQRKGLGLPVGVPSVEKIRSSRLPDAIKTAMIEKPIPIPEISLSEGLDMNIVNKAKKIMEQDGSITSKQPQKRKQTISESNLSVNGPVNNSDLEQIIENVIRRVLDEKLTQILTAQHMSTINESLAIKVGDSIFTGKITKVKNSK